MRPLGQAPHLLVKLTQRKIVRPAAAASRRPERSVDPTQDSVLLRAGDSSLTILPALGGKIASLRLAGREWLWTSDVTPWRVPDDGMRSDDASYVELADTGGYDECLPTVGPCTLPRDIREFGGLRLPDHGELWSQQPTLDIRQDGNEQQATVTWLGRRMPYRFERSAILTSGDRLTMRYGLTNLGQSPLPFLWSAHPLLPLTDRTRLHLPAGTRMRVDAVHGLPADAMLVDHRWPMLRSGDRELDLSRPAESTDGIACKVFLDLPPGRVVAGVEDDGARLDVTFDGGEVTHFGLWMNNRGWTPFANGRPYRNLAVEPCIGAPDSLTKALTEWKAAAWLPPRETREWTLAWSARRT